MALVKAEGLRKDYRVGELVAGRPDEAELSGVGPAEKQAYLEKQQDFAARLTRRRESQS